MKANSSRKPTAWNRFRSDFGTMFALGLLVLFCVLSLVWPWIGAPSSIEVSDVQFGAPSQAHWFGTDVNGRDLLSRTLLGTQISLIVGISGGVVALVIGVIWGATAGFFGGWVDRVLMRIVDILYALPTVIFVIAVVTTLEAALQESMASLWTPMMRFPLLLFGIGAVSWLNMARVVRGRVLEIAQAPYVDAARSLGRSNLQIILRHVAPNTVGVALTYLVLTAPSVILYESFLSYLGLGVPAPYASLGSLIAEGASQINPMRANWWTILFPAVFLVGILAVAGSIGEGLKKAFDPRRTVGVRLE